LSAGPGERLLFDSPYAASRIRTFLSPENFIAQNHLIATGETFNGFLPDIAAPRILRTYAYEKALDFASGDASTTTTITDAAATFSTTARNGLGEWAGARLVLRPGLPTVAMNSSFSFAHFDLKSPIIPSLCLCRFSW